MAGPERNTTRSIYLHPTGDGDKSQWTAIGAATDWQAVSKGITPGASTPSNTSGVTVASSNQFEEFTFASFAGSLNAGEYVNYVRPWVYLENLPAQATTYSSAVLADAPTAYYRLGESSGTTATNSAASGATHNGSYVNTPTLAVAGGLIGDTNTAATFASASSQRVTLTTLGTLGQSALTLTVEFWIKTTNTTTRQCIFGTVDTGVSMIVAGYLNSLGNETFAADRLLFQVRSDSGGGHLRCEAHTTTGQLTDGEWHHVVMRVDSATAASVYVDGEPLYVTMANNTNPGITSTGNLEFAMGIAARNLRGTFDGYLDASLDEFAFYPTRLSSGRIYEHYRIGVGDGTGGSIRSSLNSFKGFRTIPAVGWKAGARQSPFPGADPSVPTTGALGDLELLSTVAAGIPAPQLKSVGAAVSGTGAVTPPHPTGTGAPVVNDIKVIVAESAGGEAITVPTGWAHITGSPVDEGGNTRLSVIWKRHVSGDTAQSIGDPGNHVIARMFVISGCLKIPDPWNVANTGTEATSDTSVSFPDATTTVANTLVFQVVSAGLPDANSTTNFTVGTNGNLTSITEHADNWTSAGTGGTGGGGFGVLTGVKATASAIGNTTATLGTASSKAMMTIAFAPQTSIYVTAVVAEVGVSSMEHLVVSGRDMIGVSSRVPYRGTFGQYAHYAFDNWLVDEGTPANTRALLREMRTRGLDCVRYFARFGSMMVDAATPHEESFIALEEGLQIALEENVRVLMTGLCMFAPAAPAFVPDWLDALTEAQRWNTFRVWWLRCAQACAGNPAVLGYDLINEPATRDDGGSWYFGTTPWQYPQYIAVTMAGRTVAQVAQAFTTEMTNTGNGIQSADLKKPYGFGGWVDGQLDAWVNPGTWILAHLYPGQSTYDYWFYNPIRDQLLAKNKPMVVEEASPPSDGWPTTVDGFSNAMHFARQAGFTVGGPNWPNIDPALFVRQYETSQFEAWKRSEYAFGKRLLRGDRLAPPRGGAARIGQRFR